MTYFAAGRQCQYVCHEICLLITSVAYIQVHLILDLMEENYFDSDKAAPRELFRLFLYMLTKTLADKKADDKRHVGWP